MCVGDVSVGDSDDAQKSNHRIESQGKWGFACKCRIVCDQCVCLLRARLRALCQKYRPLCSPVFLFGLSSFLAALHRQVT